jgi:glycosyltransferase involved in cell wall biosynthesis
MGKIYLHGITLRGIKMIRVNLIENSANLHYRIAKNLRQMGVDAHLYYHQNADPQNFPYWDEPHLLNNMPDWIHPFSSEQIGRYPFRGLPSTFAHEIAECDILHVENMGVIWASQTGKPFIWDPFGWDLQFYSFYSFWQRYWQFTHHSEYFLAPIAYRRAMADASTIVYGLWYRFMNKGFKLINQLVSPDRFVHSIPMSIDTQIFCPGERKPVRELLSELGIVFDIKGLVIFHPTRIMFTENSYLNKGNDRLFCALARLKKSGYNFTLILGEKKSPGEQAARELTRNLEIEDRVVWVPKMERHKLVEWFRAADIGADQFVGGALGLVSFETMACGTPLLSFLQLTSDEETFWPPTKVYTELPPVINASTEDEIFQALVYYSEHKAELEQLGRKSREWVVNNISGEIVAGKFLELYKHILAEDSLKSKLKEPKKLTPASCSDNIPIKKQKIYDFLLKGDIEKAKESLVEALDLAPDDPELIQIIAYVLILIRPPIKDEIRKIWKNRPHIWWMSRQFLKNQISGSGSKAAIDMLKYAIELLPDEPGLVSTLKRIKTKAPWITFLRMVNYRRGLIGMIRRLVKINNTF